uniref:SFRICE_004559 n=1 Tax=Spodoptera frugiperda TaxID=7108 RepID=A0A2H1WHM8_SPOFR
MKHFNVSLKLENGWADLANFGIDLFVQVQGRSKRLGKYEVSGGRCWSLGLGGAGASAERRSCCSSAGSSAGHQPPSSGYCAAGASGARTSSSAARSSWSLATTSMSSSCSSSQLLSRRCRFSGASSGANREATSNCLLRAWAPPGSRPAPQKGKGRAVGGGD